ncbi:MAG: ankyrin repeat domain-containing protein [Ilumatobacter sp.]|uniref:ankyrin repeat domain-containing protein n=1 Tax=Ilumatobacter sp. TaxID=1967498 RepID=UPI003C76C16B
MSMLPPRPDLDQLRRLAKDRLKAARAGDHQALDWINAASAGVTLSAAQLRLARDHGFASWPSMQLEIARRSVLDLRDPETLAAFVADHPELATADLQNWRDHPLGASPIGYLAMARHDTTKGRWRNVTGTGAAVSVLIAAGAPVDGEPGDRETPLITASSYGDVEIAAVLIAAGADLDAVAAEDAGGVPGGSALLHAAVFAMTEVLDLLVAAGARIRSFEEAAAAGVIDAWPLDGIDRQTGIRGLIMAVDHQRLDVIGELVAAGVPIDEADDSFGRHPLRLAAANGRPASVRCLLALGADSLLRDGHGRSALDICRRSRSTAIDTGPYDDVEALLAT